MYTDYQECSHIINIFDKQNQTGNKGNLYLSSVYSLDKSWFRSKLGIDCVFTIINKRSYNQFEVEEKLKKHGVTHHKWIDLEDMENQNIYNHLDSAHAYIREMLGKTNVLVHCQMGISRSSSIVIALFMKEYGMGYEKARRFTKEKREIVQPNQKFESDLLKFQGQLKAIYPNIDSADL